jgi:murein DD-endopeptidase MepM/ murein hydrolase activator NlpD
LQRAGWNPDCTDPISEMGPNPPTNNPALYQRMDGLCHHDYLAADIFNKTGTPVVAVRPGRIVSAHDSGFDDNGCPFGMSVRLYSDPALGGDGKWYFFQHMLKPAEGGGLKVSLGDKVKAGDELGEVGTDRDAECTKSHTHFDISPVDNGFHRGFDGTGGPVLDPMPALKAAYEALKDK